jgi:hypothetical protein
MDAAREPVWEASGLLARARLYLALLDLRSGEEGAAGSAVGRLLAALEEGTEAPVDLVLDGVANAAILDVAGAEEVACHALQRYGHQALDRLDLGSLAARSDAFRRALYSLLQENDGGLKSTELWLAWEALLNGCLAASPRDLGLAAEALDALERLAERGGCGDRFLALLDGDAWDPVWERSDRDEAVIKFNLRAGRRAETEVLFFGLVQDAISEGRLRDGDDLIEMMRKELGEVEALESLERRLAAVRGEETATPVTPAAPAQPLTILFVGGNETQQAYFPRLEGDFASSHPQVRIVFEATGWSSNWGRTLEVLERKVAESDAVVIMRFVRTNLGSALRKCAGERGKPWVACTGHGLQSLRLAIGEAIDVVGRKAVA